MRKGKRIARLERQYEGVESWCRSLQDRIRAMCAHPQVTYQGASDFDLVAGSDIRHGFYCSVCGKHWYMREASAIASPRFRAILEACGVLEPEAEKGE